MIEGIVVLDDEFFKSAKMQGKGTALGGFIEDVLMKNVGNIILDGRAIAIFKEANFFVEYVKPVAEF